MVKKEMSLLFKERHMMKNRVDNSELALKGKEVELKKAQLQMVKVEEMLKKNGKELEGLRKKVHEVEELSRLGIYILQAQVATLKNELDLLEAEVTMRPGEGEADVPVHDGMDSVMETS